MERPLSMRAIVIILSIVLAVPAAAAAQSSVQRSLRVRVVDSLTSEPLAGVTVDHRCFDDYPRSTRFINEGTGRSATDARGEFVITLSEPAVCILMNVMKPGFGHGHPREARTRPMQLVPGETVRIVRLEKMATIEGRVIDQAGRPIAGTPVRLMGGGVRPGAPFVLGTATTDERGRFSFGPVAASSTYKFLLSHVRLLEPALTVTLRPGELRTGLDLRAERLPTFRVAGRITDMTGSGIDAMAYLDRADSLVDQPLTIAQVRADSNGQFVHTGVPRGQYRIRVDTGAPGAIGQFYWQALLAAVPVTVDADVNNIAAVARPGPTICGSVRFEGGPRPPGRILIGVWGTGGASGRRTAGGNVEVDQAGEFAAGGLVPGRYVISLSLPPSGFRLKSTMWRGRDVSIQPMDLTTESAEDLVVTFTRQSTTVSGIVRDAQGGDDGGATVFVFSPDPQLWIDGGPNPRVVRSVATNQLGRYAVADAPPGEYLIVAVASEDGPGVIFSNRDLLRRLAPLATRIRIEYDAPVTQDLRRVAVPATAR